MAIDYNALRTEIQTDPNGYGYAVHVTSGADSLVADLLNQVRAAIAIERETIPAYEVFEAIVPSEWTALTATNRTLIGQILSMGEIKVKGTNTRAAFLAAFGVGTTTRSNLAALQARQGSRAEQLFGQSVTADDVARALRG